MDRQPPDPSKRRTLRDIKRWLSASEVYELITSREWPYKTKRDFHHARDRALMSLDFVGAFRNNEPLGDLRKINFILDDPNYLILQDAKISKRTKKVIAKYGARVTIRERIRLPKFGHPLKPFTDLILHYLSMLKDEDVLFPFKERRHHQIVKHCTGKWVHWLRSMGENWYGHNVFRNDPVNLAKFIGVVNVQSVMPYVGFDEESYEERLRKAVTDRR